jgi:Arc/MetJ family transcription regulator
MTRLSSKREVVDLALKTLLRLRQQSEIKALRGNITWDGELDAVRRDEQNSRVDRRST